MDGEAEPKLRPTRGTHILVPRLTRGREALYLTAGRDDRLFFVIPWGNLSLVGTTDVDDRGDPDTVAPTTGDIDYLLSETARHLRTAPLGRTDVVAAFAGLRPLVDDSGAQASRVSREHRIFESASGLISVGGGKYTTYRAVAAETAALVCSRLGKGQGRSITDRIPLPGGATGNFTAFVRRLLPELSAEYGLPPARLENLLRQYGSRTPRLLALLKDDPGLIRPVIEGSPLLGAQVVYAVEFELARTPEDVLRRRTQLALSTGRGLAELAAVSALMGRRLQVPAESVNQWQNDYRKRHSTP
jgi:glycerol-3-phosphate dehydrogenase